MNDTAAQLLESHGQYAACIYGRNANSNYPLLRLDYAVLATGGTGFIVWWDGGFNSDATKCYIVEIEMDPFAALERSLPICSQIIVTAAALKEIDRRGDGDRLRTLQYSAFDSENHPIGESAATFGVHGYVIWGHDTNLEVPGCLIDYGASLDGARFECYYRQNIINANTRQLLLLASDDPMAMIRAARKRHSHIILSVRAVSVMQSRGLDLSSMRESMSEKRGIGAVREAARILRSGRGNVVEARTTLSRYGFTPEITMPTPTDTLIDRIDRLCEISTGALVWASKHKEEFPESRNKIGGSKGKYKARKVGQFGAKSLVNESGGDWAIFVKYMGDGNGPYDVVSRHPTQADAEQRLKREISQRKLRHPDTFKDAWVDMHPDAAMRDYRKRPSTSESAENAAAYRAHIEKLLAASNKAATNASSMHSKDRGFGVGYRGYLACLQRGDDPRTLWKPMGVIEREGWEQARADLSEMKPMTDVSASEFNKKYKGKARVVEGDEKATYIAHAKQLYKASEEAFKKADSKRLDGEEDPNPSRHHGPFGFGYRTYLKTILRGDDPNNTKPKGEHLAGWNQARKDLASLDPMTEARKGPAKFKQSDRPGHSVRRADVPQFMLARHIDPEKVSADDHDTALNYLTQTLSTGQLRTNAKVAYQQAKSYWSKGDKTGAMSQHWWGSMYAKAAGDSFVPASSLFSESAAVMSGTKYGINGLTFVVRPSQDNPLVFNVYAQRRNGLGFVTTVVANNKDAVIAAVTAANKKVFESVDEVAGYTLRDSDKKAVKAWVQQKPAEGKWVISDGTTLRTTSLGAADMAKWVNGKPHIGMAYGNTTQTLINFIRKELRDQGMTTIGKLTTKGEPTASESQVYRTLNDAGKKIPDLSEGTTEVWFSKARTLDESTIRAATLPDTHVLVGKVKCSNPQRLFVLLQEEKWSPRGEAADMLRERGVVHSSMSVGDVIVTGGRHYMVAEHGFKRLDKQ